MLKKRIVPCKYKQWILVSDSFKIKFHPSGHILGSAFVEVAVKVDSGEKYKKLNNTKRIVFSGDLGAPYAPILSMPQSPYQADIVVLASLHKIVVRGAIITSYSTFIKYFLGIYE